MDTITRNALLDSIEDTLGPLEDRQVSEMTIIALSRKYYGPTSDAKEFIDNAMSRLEKTWAIQDAR
tara:strand:+ start:2931 stop:3128 length:198 start_codon:yes stop_codon:yes gene_type:complete